MSGKYYDYATVIRATLGSVEEDLISKEEARGIIAGTLSERYPELSRHLKEGSVILEGDKQGKLLSPRYAYVGMASDGVMVSFGGIGDEAGVESYLVARPNPTDW